VLVPFAAFLDEAGLPAWKYLESARLPPEPQQGVDELVPLVSVLNFTDRISRVTGVEDVGFVVGGRTSLEVLGSFGAMLADSASLSQALHKVVTAVKLYNSAEDVWIRRAGDRVLLCQAFRVADVKGRRHGDFFTLLRLIDVVRLAAGPGWIPDAVHLRMPEFARREYFANLLQTHIRLGGDYCAVEFNASLLAAPVRPPQSATAEAPEIGKLTSSAPALELAGSVRQAVEALLQSGRTDIGFVAAMTGMSVRNLQRRLREEGLNYSQIVDESRFEFARRLLRDTDLSLIDIAFESGYGEAANFTRAFKRWAGVPPKNFRRRYREQGAVDR
jgi:AraC-like DNA-binding protein